MSVADPDLSPAAVNLYMALAEAINENREGCKSLEAIHVLTSLAVSVAVDNHGPSGVRILELIFKRYLLEAREETEEQLS